MKMTANDLMGVIANVAEQSPDDIQLQQACYQIAEVVAEAHDEIGRERTRKIVLMLGAIWRRSMELGEDSVQVHRVSGTG